MSEPAAPSAVAVRAAVFAEDLAARSDALEVLAPNILSLGHWARGFTTGELYAAQSRVWIGLLFSEELSTSTLRHARSAADASKSARSSPTSMAAAACLRGSRDHALHHARRDRLPLVVDA